jgi:hypothetical protein
MKFAVIDEGAYRIYAGALDAPPGPGFIAGLVISRCDDAVAAPREAWKDLSLCAGYHWPTDASAISYAIRIGRKLIRSASQRLAC